MNVTIADSKYWISKSIMPPKTRKSSGGMDPNVLFPAMTNFLHPTKLPAIKSVIGVMRHLMAGGKARMAVKEAAREVAKRVYAKWFHDTIFCISLSTIVDRLEKMWLTFKEGKRRFNEGRLDGKAVQVLNCHCCIDHVPNLVLQEYKSQLADRANNLFDIAATTPKQIATCKADWCVAMTAEEHRYYEDQKGPRLLECDKAVDPVFYHAVMRRERQLAREEKHRQQRMEQFSGKNLDEITELLIGEFGQLSSPGASSVSSVSPSPSMGVASRSSRILPSASSSEPVAKKRKLYQEKEEIDKNFPAHQAHIRNSERKVRDEFYLTIASLTGHGLSLNESCLAVVEVANGMMERHWKMPDSDSDSFDSDTLPNERNIREKLDLIEAETLSMTVDTIFAAKEAGDSITHAIDSTTKRGVGTFATQGIHINREAPLPIPLLGIHGESTEEVALQIDFGIQILAAVSGKSPAEIYSKIDVHMTDSVSHNKGVADVLQDLYDVSTKPGQIFCSTHTTLGFSHSMNKDVANIEGDMKVEQILQKFMVAMKLDSKHGSLAGQALDMCLKLVAPEYRHKPWNYYKKFVNYLQQKNVPVTLFSYKDKRFGCLSQAAGVLLHLLPHLMDFLSSNPHINNCLACLVREVLELPYLKVVYVVFAAIGVRIIEPFYSKTIDTRSTHSSLKEFYTILYRDLRKAVNEDFFKLEAPVLESEDTELFSGVLKSYGEPVVQAIKETALEHIEDSVTLVNVCLPNLAVVLARQRRDYGISDEFPAEFPIYDQCANVDKTPVNNIAMERNCGLVDYRLHKLQRLSAVSRSMVLARRKEVSTGEPSSFRSYKQEVMGQRELKVEWQKGMEEKFAKGAEEKQEVAQLKERKRLTKLEDLKEDGGPFTCAEEVRQFLDNEELTEKVKQKRMKKEIQFARESSTTLPSADPLFKIQVTLPNKKRRDKTSEEFGASLMAFLGKKADDNVMDYNLFKSSLQKYSNSDGNNN